MMAADLTDALLIDGRELARRLGIGVSMLHSLKRQGRLPLQITKLGRRVLYRADEARRWVECGCPNAQKWSAIRAIKGAA
jgi:predicted DNA-binding transcriptional regulator AlpA